MNSLVKSYKQFQELLFEYVNLTKVILIIIYVVGYFGFILFPKNFISLTPFMLILNFLLIVLYQSHRILSFVRLCFIVFLFGFIIEVLGVSTGKIFGYYHYGNGLGLKLKAVPIIIGINWLILTYCSAQIANKAVREDYYFLRSIVGAFLMVLVDIFIEMVAARLDYWHWDGGIIPLQNYIAWLIISFFFNLIYQTINFKTQNKIASTVFVLQLLFFFALSYKSSIEKNNKKSPGHINFNIKKSKK